MSDPVAFCDVYVVHGFANLKDQVSIIFNHFELPAKIFVNLYDNPTDDLRVIMPFQRN
jgi:hypothetical protein